MLSSSTERTPAHDANHALPAQTRASIAEYLRLRTEALRVLPTAVAQDVITIAPEESIDRLRIERERRLRQVLRRYENQIQHGCHNRSCTAPSCLSYRRRNSKTPLRPYTQTSARALAAHLVQEAARCRKDPVEGLCQNQPVVPWYQDPRTTESKRRSLDVLPPRRSYEKIIAHRLAGTDAQYLLVWKDGGTPKFAWSAESTLQDRSVLEKYKKESPLGLVRNEVDLSDLEIIVDGVKIEPHSNQENGRAPESESVDHVRDQKLDQASFTQRLWNTTAVQNLEEARSSIVHPPAQHRRSALRPAGMYSNTAFCGLILRRLSWDTINFLHENFDPEQHQPTPFQTFIKQSVYRNVGDPIRLLESARLWHLDLSDSADRPKDDDGPLIDSHPMADKARLTCEADETPKYPRKIDVTATISAFWGIGQISGGTDDLYSALYDMLQRCYSVSHTGFDGGEAATTSRKTFKALGGGLIDHTKADDKHERLSRKSACRPNRKQISELFALIIIALAEPFLYRYRSGDDAEFAFFLVVMGERSDNARLTVLQNSSDKKQRRDCIEILDIVQDWHRQRLISAFTDCIAHHMAATSIAKHKSLTRGKPYDIINDAIGLLINFKSEPPPVINNLFLTLHTIILDIAKTVLMTEWDREPIIARTSSTGGALELITALYHTMERWHRFELLSVMRGVADSFNEWEVPIQWLTFEPNGRQTHILAYPFLFDLATLTNYFRIINVNAMRKSYESALMVYSDASQFLQSGHIPVYSGEDVLAEMRPFMAKFFVLTIRRDNVLEDALNQLWRRQRREVLRPLKVRLGRDEGEDGLDHGGVQQEFFRLAFAEAFNPDYGMFTVDDRTHMVWFQPGTLEPVWKYEALGILMSLAIYNGVTLPITMPLAFYRKILGWKVKELEHIEDGWPALEKGLQMMLEYDGDVAEDIGRTYEFSYDFGGTVHSIDMSRSPKAELRIRPSRKGKERASSPLPPPQPMDFPVSESSTRGTPDTSSPTSDPASSTPLSSPTLEPTSESPEASEMKSKASKIRKRREAEAEAKLPRTSKRATHIAPADSSAPLVTNGNRNAFVRDYIHHLTSLSIAPQFNAFLSGLHTCLTPRSLSLFTPPQLRSLIEGHKSVPIADLQAATTYEDYDANEPYIREFWQIVADETVSDPEFVGQLLEFVTASSRMPVGGLRQGSFVIQQHPYGDTEVDVPKEGSGGGYKGQLPSSSTCYGRLLLPRYVVVGEDVLGEEDGVGAGEKWKMVLRERVVKAVTEGRGFGML